MRRKRQSKSKIAKIADEALQAIKQYQYTTKIKEYIPIVITRDLELFYVKASPKGYYLCKTSDPVCFFCKQALTEVCYVIVAWDDQSKVKAVVTACHDCVEERNKDRNFIWCNYFIANSVAQYSAKIKKI